MPRQTMELPAETSVLIKIGTAIEEAARHAGFNAEETGDLQLAVDEACTNTILHGLDSNPQMTFKLEIEWRKGRIDILITEDGKPFDPGRIERPDLDAPLENRKEGGLGIYFMHRLMDVVEFDTTADGRKTLRMVKTK